MPSTVTMATNRMSRASSVFTGQPPAVAYSLSKQVSNSSLKNSVVRASSTTLATPNVSTSAANSDPTLPARNDVSPAVPAPGIR